VDLELQRRRKLNVLGPGQKLNIENRHCGPVAGLGLGGFNDML
jgi:hypothetical protein